MTPFHLGAKYLKETVYHLQSRSVYLTNYKASNPKYRDLEAAATLVTLRI